MRTKIFFSIVIATFNSEKTIKECLKSVKTQSFENYEIVIIDNNSTDRSLKIIKKLNFKKIKIISETDTGIYDALNKGIKKSSGEVISILHSDDLYSNQNVLKNVYNKFSKNIDIVYGNLIYVQRNNINIPVRKWIGKLSNKNNFYKGWHPPHPTFFAKRTLYKKYGYYNNNIGNPADVELMFRFLIKHKISSRHLNRILIKMRYGGVSNKKLISILKQNLKILQILKIDKKPIKIFIFFVNKIKSRVNQFIL